MNKVKVTTDPVILNKIMNNYLSRLENIPIPKVFTRYKRFAAKLRHIIIHDSNCLKHADAVLNIDGPKTAIGALKANNISKEGMSDINYHYIIDRISNDYEILSGRPIHTYCEHPDVETAFRESLHVLILADLDVEIPKTRLYQILAYRCLAPLIRMLRMGSDPGDIIRFHDEVQIKKGEIKKCPGAFFVREMLIAQTRRFI